MKKKILVIIPGFNPDNNYKIYTILNNNLNKLRKNKS